MEQWLLKLPPEMWLISASQTLNQTDNKIKLSARITTMQQYVKDWVTERLYQAISDQFTAVQR